MSCLRNGPLNIIHIPTYFIAVLPLASLQFRPRAKC